MWILVGRATVQTQIGYGTALSTELAVFNVGDTAPVLRVPDDDDAIAATWSIRPPG